MDSTLEPAVLAVRDAALALVQDERGARVEDYVCALASATGEAVIVDAGLFDIERNDMTPGAAVMGDALNELLSGDATDLDGAGSTTVVGILRDELVPDVVSPDAFPPLRELYELVVRSFGDQPWGTVAVSLDEDHEPSVLPIRMAYELRPVVMAAVEQPAAIDKGESSRSARHVLCAHALASAIAQTADALDPAISTRLALEVAFGMAKMVPMSQAAFEQTANEP